MVNKLTYIESEQYNPYKNLAVEEYLSSTVKKKNVSYICGRISIRL